MEIARLVSRQDLILHCSLAHWLETSRQSLQLETLEFSHDVARESHQLPGDFHRDPSDRILVATARIQKIYLLTADERILNYPHVLTVNARK